MFDSRVGIDSSTEALRCAVTSFLNAYSIETNPHAAQEIDSFPEYLTRGTTVYVAHPPKCSIDEVLDLAIDLRSLGYHPVPHLIARKFESQKHLERTVESLAEAGISQILIVAGDLDKPAGPYNSTMDVIQTGLITKYGIKSVGVSGHPEGSPSITATDLRQALRDKAQFAIDAGLNMYIVTQFGFNATAVIDWEATLANDNISLPIYVGLAGFASPKQLLRYAYLCGIGSSLKMIAGRARVVSKKIELQSVNELILTFARHQLKYPTSKITRAHFFPFGGAKRTVSWLNKIQSGRLEICRDGRDMKLTVE